MAFSSLNFIFIFLPIFLITYFITNKKYKRIIILLGSIVFYLIGTCKKPEYLLLLIFSITVNFILANLIEKYERDSKLILAVGVIFNVNLLLIYKYFDFFISIINNNFNTEINELNLILPIGISFYTFELISYIVDVYNKKTKAEKSILKVAGYIFMFPQLISGPIVTYKEINQQLEKKKINITNITLGIKYFILGLAFKVIIADRIGILWNDIFMIGVDSISSTLAWLGIIAYTIQIYLDFQGYSLMAIGLGKVIGIELPSNFDAPYLTTSMSDFFRRWHMTLGRWFKNYIYIPLGGNRKGKTRMIINIMIVWLVTGLWHGASYNYILWGIFVGIVIILEKLFLGKYLNKSKMIGHIYMFILIPIMWSIFSIKDLSTLSLFIRKLFSFEEGIISLDYLKYIKTYGYLILIGLLLCTKTAEKLLLKKETNNYQIIILLGLFWISINYLYKGLNNAFIYFDF